MKSVYIITGAVILTSRWVRRHAFVLLVVVAFVYAGHSGAHAATRTPMPPPNVVRAMQHGYACWVEIDYHIVRGDVFAYRSEWLCRKGR